MLTLDVRAAARALGGDISGRDGLVCPGPGHSRQDRSLSVRLDPNARDGFVVHSFAGDDPIICKDHVRERLRIEALKPNGKVRPADNSANPATSTIGFSVVATYVYTEPDDAPLYRVRRLASKKFIQERADGRGGWLPGLNGQRTVPYRWPELVKYPDATVFICEGEKDADRVASLGACATTISGSAKWTEEAGCSSLERLAADQRVDERFLQLLAQFTQQGRNLSDKQNANFFGPKMFAQEKGADGKKISKSAFQEAMTRLFAANKIHVESYGPPSRGWYRLALGPRLQE
jgi:hypothetical protein